MERTKISQAVICKSFVIKEQKKEKLFVVKEQFLILESLGLKESEFCYCNFDDERIATYPTLLNDIYALHLEMYRIEPVFFFDEIQEVPGWEKFVNRMYEQGRKVYVTGSNARLLSSEISTSLTGRNKVLELLPFSFSEYLRVEGRAYEVERLSVKQRSLLLNDLNAYLETGGFPLVVKEKLSVTEAIQVVYELNAENIQREINGLTEAMQTFGISRGTLVVFDAHLYQTELPQGVSVVSASEWMLSK